MPSSLAERVAINVRIEMARKSITQAELARRLFGKVDNTTRNLIWRRVSGITPFGLEELLRTAEVLGVTVDSLYQDVA